MHYSPSVVRLTPTLQGYVLPAFPAYPLPGSRCWRWRGRWYGECDGCTAARREDRTDRPEPEKTYRLTGAPGEPSIVNGSTWRESGVEPPGDKTSRTPGKSQVVSPSPPAEVVKTPKVMLLWLRKGCRVPKCQGTATATCSAATIHDFRRMARDGEGRLYVVEADTAAQARELIARWRRGEGTGTVTMAADGQRTVAIGPYAAAAIGGATEAVRRWDGRSRQQGRVTEEQSRALPRSAPAALGRLTVGNLFGGGPTGRCSTRPTTALRPSSPAPRTIPRTR